MLPNSPAASLPTPTLSEIVRSFPFRVGLYGLATLVVFESAYAGICRYGAGFMGAENGPVEIAQVALALVGAIGLFSAAWWSPLGKAGLVVCGSVVAYAAARESDQLFESLLFDDAYKWLVGLPLVAVCVATVFIGRKTLIAESMWLMQHPVATLFAIAGIYLCFVCQVLDRPEMWSGLESIGDVTDTKASIEEYSELFAYLLLAFSGVEAAALARQRQKLAASEHDQVVTSSEIRIAA